MGDDRCVFCEIVKGKTKAHVIYEDNDYIAFLDKHPQSRGHTQLIPKIHYRWIHDVPDMGGMFCVAQKIIHVIMSVTGADHATLGAFGHEVSHAHVWIVPEYQKAVKIREGFKTVQDHKSQLRLSKKIRERFK